MMNQRMKAYPGRWTWKSMTYELMFKNIADLQSDLSAVVGYLPFSWALLVKFFIPPVVLILFGLACDAENPNGTKVFGHYEGYVFSPYQILGILCVVFTGFLFLSSLVVPEMYTFLEKPAGEKPCAIHAEPQKVTIEKSDQTGMIDADIEQDSGEMVEEATAPSESVFHALEMENAPIEVA
jgi:hypothetical protein